MGYRLIARTLFTIALMTLPLFAGAALESELDDIFADYDRFDSPGCAVAVVQNGEIVFKKGYGIANLEHHAPILPDTKFYAGSVSKQFTAMCIALLEEDGALGYDDDINEHLPELPDYDPPIRVHDLIHHTNGLQQYFAIWEERDRHLEDVMNATHAMEMIAGANNVLFEAGEKYSYSNSGYFLMAQIVGRVSGMAFPDFADERIFKPLGMTNSHFHDDRNHIIENRAMSYFERDDGGYGVYLLNYELVGPGGLYTTVEDLAKWDSNFYDNRLGHGAQSLIDRTLKTGVLNDGTTLGYAYGLNHGERGGKKVIDHTGSLAGYRAMMLRFPDEKTTILILGNLASINAEGLAHQVADVLFE